MVITDSSTSQVTPLGWPYRAGGQDGAHRRGRRRPMWDDMVTRLDPHSTLHALRSRFVRSPCRAGGGCAGPAEPAGPGGARRASDLHSRTMENWLVIGIAALAINSGRFAENGNARPFPGTGGYARAEWTQARFRATSSRCRAASVTGLGKTRCARSRRTRGTRSSKTRCARSGIPHRRRHPPALRGSGAASAGVLTVMRKRNWLVGLVLPIDGCRDRRHRRGGYRRRRRQWRRGAVGARRGLPASTGWPGRHSPGQRGPPG